MWQSMTASQVGYRLSWLAMFIRVAALVYALGVLTFYPHPDIAAKGEMLFRLWLATVVYTTLLLVVLVSRANSWLRSLPFLILDTLLVLLVVNLAGGGYRNVFSLYSLLPSVTTALSLPSATKPFRRAFLLIGVVLVSSVGFILSLFLDGYTISAIIEKRQVDEVVLRTASHWVTGGLLAALAAMMIAWQYSRDRTNALREQAAVEEERRRIATDIHDGVLSQLTALSRRAEYASLMLAEDPPTAQVELQRVVTMAADVHEGIRWIVRALRHDPAQLTLAEELIRIVDRFRRNTGMKVELILPDADIPVPIDTVRHLGFVVTEALTNVWKHAGTDSATLEMRQENGRLLLQIVDQGKGLGVNMHHDKPTGLGLLTMRERAHEIGAQLDIASSENEGTCVRIWVPVARGKGEEE